MYKTPYFFDFLINAPYSIKLPFVELIKLVYDKLRIYKEYYKEN